MGRLDHLMRAFEREHRTVHLGGRRLVLGPLRFTLGPGEYSVRPLTFERVLELGSLVRARLGGAAVLARGFSGLAPEVLRVVAPFLVAGLDRRDIERASPEQLARLGAAADVVNDVAAIVEAIAPAEKPGDPAAFGRMLIAVAREMHVWPADLLDMPYVDVKAVVDELLRQADQARAASGVAREQTAEEQRLSAQLETWWRDRYYRAPRPSAEAPAAAAVGEEGSDA